MTAKDFTGICGVPISGLLTPTSQQRKISEQSQITLLPSNGLHIVVGTIIVIG
jgi:hypothetical protein